MSPETVRQLDALGVMPALTTHRGAPLEGTRIAHTSGSACTGRFDAVPHAPSPRGLGLPRRILDTVLLRAAEDAGATVLQQAQVIDLIHRHGQCAGVQLRDANGTHAIQARVVVGADGLRSVVARRAGLQRRGALRRVALVAHVAQVRALGNTTELHVSRDGYAGLNHLGDGVANVALVVSAEQAMAARGRLQPFLAERLERFDGLRGRVDMRHMVREVIATGPFDVRARRSVGNGVLLVGDAADFFDPFTGEGIGAALAGAEMASAVLQHALDVHDIVDAAALQPYRTLRRRRFAGKWLLERMIGYAMFAPSLFDRALRKLDARGMADTMIGVTGGFVPARAVLNPAFLWRMVV